MLQGISRDRCIRGTSRPPENKENDDCWPICILLVHTNVKLYRSCSLQTTTRDLRNVFGNWKCLMFRCLAFLHSCTLTSHSVWSHPDSWGVSLSRLSRSSTVGRLRSCRAFLRHSTSCNIDDIVFSSFFFFSQRLQASRFTSENAYCFA